MPVAWRAVVLLLPEAARADHLYFVMMPSLIVAFVTMLSKALLQLARRARCASAVGDGLMERLVEY